MLPVYDLRTDDGEERLRTLLQNLREGTGPGGEASATVQEVVRDVRERGDPAVVDAMRRWTDRAFEADRMRVSPAELKAAHQGLDPETAEALEEAIAHVRAYQEHIRPEAPAPLRENNLERGLRYTPVDSAALLVPGGRAAYPSTALMLGLPALVAGVPADRLSVITPPPTRREGEDSADVPTIVLAACAALGLERVYRIGGAQGVAAVSFGTETIPAHDMIAGPGNVYTQLAKQAVAGAVGTDGFYGPSEILTVADEQAPADQVAADLIAQAEHDPGRCFLLSWSDHLLEAVQGAIGAQLPHRRRRDAVEPALRDGSAAVRVRDRDQAAEVANRIACEHVSVVTSQPEDLMGRIQHGGSFFVGAATPVAAGDYWAGPSHCLPTGTTARFASGLSPHTFLKRSGWVVCRTQLPSEGARAIQKLAEVEGLEAHAHSVRVRSEQEG